MSVSTDDPWYQDSSGNWYLYYIGSWWLSFGNAWYQYYDGPWFYDQNGNWYLYYSGTVHAYSATPPAASYAVDTVLPTSGSGFYSYSAQLRQVGTKPTINTVIASAYQWYVAHGATVPIGIGDISLSGGGPFIVGGVLVHNSHQRGVDVDIRPLRSDGRQDPVQWNTPFYSQQLTRELIDLLRGTGRIRVILFNDPQLIAENRVQFFVGHDNHLHVSFVG
jgi:hypothetical protein